MGKNKVSNILDYWCAWVLALLLLIQWIFVYDQGAAFVLSTLGLVIFSVIGTIIATNQLVKNNTRKFVYIMLPVMLFSLEFTTLMVKAVWVRDYIEVVIQKNIYIPEISEIERENGTGYKEWRIGGNREETFWIVYDSTDEIIKKHRTRGYAYRTEMHYYVEKFGEHLYMLRKTYTF